MPMRRALHDHWPEYLMEAALLAIFMVAATAYTVALEHPSSPLRAGLPSALARRGVMGVLVGATAVALIRSPWGQRSGAHFNPSTTLTFLRLGKIAPWDAFFYVAFQFAGAIAGVVVARLALGSAVADPSVAFIATVPGAHGAPTAFVAEVVIAFALMLAVLALSNHPRLGRFTPLAVGALVALYILVEAPLSGMSLNPARSFAPALVGELWRSLWVYFTAPPLGMLLAAEAYVAVRGVRAVHCAKLHHRNSQRCIFCCRFHELVGSPAH